METNKTLWSSILDDIAKKSISPDGTLILLGI